MRPSINLDIVKLDPSVKLPSYAYPGDAGLDLASSVDLVIAPGERAMVPTGLAVAIPEGYAGLVTPRSGLAAKKGLSIVNTPGLIDSSYRGELKVILLNTDKEAEIAIAAGDRIAQLVIIEIPIVNLNPVESLDQTDRGEKGFGSSNVR